MRLASWEVQWEMYPVGFSGEVHKGWMLAVLVLEKLLQFQERCAPIRARMMYRRPQEKTLFSEEVVQRFRRYSCILIAPKLFMKIQ